MRGGKERSEYKLKIAKADSKPEVEGYYLKTGKVESKGNSNLYLLANPRSGPWGSGGVPPAYAFSCRGSSCGGIGTLSFKPRTHNNMKLRVGVLQLNPQRGAIPSNIERANKVLSSRLGGRPLDLLVLPEFGLHGYKYANRSELEPYLEGKDGGGPGIEWAKNTSRNLNCHVILGYPERGDNGKIYNSASLVDPMGDIAYNFRKSFLYETDEAFECAENERGFESVKIGENLNIQVGICMDLNPYKFEAPFDAYEFANKAKENKANLVVCPMAWLNSQSPSLLQKSHEEKMAARQQLEKELDDSSPPETSTVNYWALRMFPFLNGPKGFQNDKRVGFICANRCGWEDDILYAGSSSIFTFNGKNTQSYSDSVEYYGSLGGQQEDLLYREIDID